MRLVKEGRIVTDHFVRVPDDASVPTNAAVIVSHGRLLADPAALLREAPTGVIWPNDRKVAELAPCLGGLALVGLVFPVFKDGRAFSQARLLREQYGFAGELRERPGELFIDTVKRLGVAPFKERVYASR